MVGFPVLNIISIRETDTEEAGYCSNNTESGHLYTDLLSMVAAIFHDRLSKRNVDDQMYGIQNKNSFLFVSKRDVDDQMYGIQNKNSFLFVEWML